MANTLAGRGTGGLRSTSLSTTSASPSASPRSHSTSASQRWTAAIGSAENRPPEARSTSAIRPPRTTLARPFAFAIWTLIAPSILRGRPGVQFVSAAEARAWRPRHDRCRAATLRYGRRSRAWRLAKWHVACSRRVIMADIEYQEARLPARTIRYVERGRGAPIVFVHGL